MSLSIFGTGSTGTSSGSESGSTLHEQWTWPKSGPRFRLSKYFCLLKGWVSEELLQGQTGLSGWGPFGTCCAAVESWMGIYGCSTVQGAQKGRFASNAAHLQAFSPYARLSAEGACCCKAGVPPSLDTCCCSGAALIAWTSVTAAWELLGRRQDGSSQVKLGNLSCPTQCIALKFNLLSTEKLSDDEGLLYGSLSHQSVCSCGNQGYPSRFQGLPAGADRKVYCRKDLLVFCIPTATSALLLQDS